MRLCALFLIILFTALPVRAQQAIDVPFTRLMTLMERGADGSYTGFAIDLARLIGTEIGTPVTIREVPDLPGQVAALLSGKVQMVAGIARLPVLRDAFVFSTPVAIDAVRLAVLANRAGELENRLSGLTIGIVPPLVGATEARAMEGNTAVEYATAEAAVLALFLGDVDAIMVPASVAYSVARRMGLDGRIAFVGDTIREIERVVALHKSRADLLSAVNDAVARLEADGRLEALRNRYLIAVPPPPAAVLTVGIADIPPLISLDGTEPTGFSVEVLRDLAGRVGVPITFREVSRTDYLHGPAAAGVDALPALVETPERIGLMDFTVATQLETINAYVAAGSEPGTLQPDDLASRTIAVSSPGIAQSLRLYGLDRNVTVYPDTPAALDALFAGQAEVIVGVESVYAEYMTRNDLRALRPALDAPLYALRTSIPLRPGLGALRDRFDAVIPGYLLSADYAALRERYYGVPVFWTQDRITAALAGVGAVILLLLATLLRQRIKARLRQRDYARQREALHREQAHSAELSTLVEKLERSNRALDEFAYIASHDLKEPLRGLGINAQFLAREALPGKVGERVARMQVLSERMQTLVTQLLAYTRVGATAAEPAPVDAREVIETLRSDLSEWLGERNAEVVQVTDIPLLRSDRTTLGMILQNLVVNGVKYNTSDARRVEIGYVERVQVRGQALENVLFVRDNGVGIAEDYRDKIFRIFSRLNKDDTFDAGPGGDLAKGTGAGLAFVRKAVELGGGQIDFTSEPGSGSTFYVTVDVAQQDEGLVS